MTRSRTRGALLLLCSIAACNSVTSSNPPDPLVVELSTLEPFAGEAVRIVVRGALEGIPDLATTLDDSVLAVTRLDDTSFAVTMPVTNGARRLTITSPTAPVANLADTTITVHGYLSGTMGLAVEGHVVQSPGAGPALMLGGVPGGLAEFSLATGVITRQWGPEVHDLLCSAGVFEGATDGEFLMVGRDSIGNCGPSTFRRFAPEPIVVRTTPFINQTMVVPVGPMTALVYINAANQSFFNLCDLGWTACQGVFDPSGLNNEIVGTVVDHGSGRLVTLAYRAGVYDLSTGQLVRVLNPSSIGGGLIDFISGVAFAADGASMFTTARRYFAERGGTIYARSTTDASVRDSLRLDEQLPMAVGVDNTRGLLFVALEDPTSGATRLRILDESTLAFRADLPITDAQVRGALSSQSGLEEFRMVVDPAGGLVYLIATNYPLFNPRRPAVVARFSLPPL